RVAVEVLVGMGAGGRGKRGAGVGGGATAAGGGAVLAAPGLYSGVDTASGAAVKSVAFDAVASGVGVKESSAAGVKADVSLEEVVSVSSASAPGCWNAARSVVDSGRMASASVLPAVPLPSAERSKLTVPATTSAFPAIGVAQL